MIGNLGAKRNLHFLPPPHPVQKTFPRHWQSPDLLALPNDSQNTNLCKSHLLKNILKSSSGRKNKILLPVYLNLYNVHVYNFFDLLVMFFLNLCCYV